MRPGLISRTRTPHVAGYYILHEGLIGYLGGSLQEIKYILAQPREAAGILLDGGWLGFTDKYWLTSLVPPRTKQ